MTEGWNKAVDEGNVHICTLLDKGGWQPCPPEFVKEKPEGCPHKEEEK